jgi:phosphate binding protein
MGKALRTLITGMMLLSMLAACGGQTTQTIPATAAPVTEAPPVATEAPAAGITEAPTEEATATTDESSTAATSTTAASGATTPGALPEVDAGQVTGDIVTAGSSTVYPLTERMAERFKDEGYAGNITIDSIGSGAGIERFCVAAETDIANASRAVKDEEKQQCADKGRQVVEFRVGTDALSVVMSSENTFVEDLTLEQLAQIFGGEVKTWDAVNPAWPKESIQLFSPGTDSGTFDYFVEVVFDEDDSKILAANPQLSENDNVLVQGIEGSPYAIGYFGYAYYNANKGKLKAVRINGVEPTEETAESNEYPISRPLYIYSAKNILQEKPQVASFINFFLTNVNDEITDVGYFPASADALNTARQNWLEATGQ